jgi:hypothetical protein
MEIEGLLKHASSQATVQMSDGTPDVQAQVSQITMCDEAAQTDLAALPAQELFGA